MRLQRMCASRLGLALLVCAVGSAASPPTFNADVAPIVYAKCVGCHRSGAVAPMPLVTYEDVRPWARAIKARVMAREMPPWFADRRFSRALKNDPSLSDAEIDTIAAWVDAGAPRGAGDPPPPPAARDGWHSFNNRPPDAIVEMSAAVDIPAEGIVPVFTLWSPNPFNEDRFIEAVELRPGAVGAVHHSDVTARTLPPGTTLGRGRAWKGGPLVDFVPVYADGRSYNELSAPSADTFRTDDYRLLFYVPGGGFQEFPPGAVKRISAGNVLAWNLHYTPRGRPQTDRHRLGLWFARTPPAREVITKRIGEAHIIEGKDFVAERDGQEFPSIPPFANDWRITAITPFQDDVTIYGVWPHMHLRGKDMTFIATYPDGREEVLLHVPRYQFQWQLQYEFAEPLHLPAGSTIKAIGHYDNSSQNKSNPDPNVPVGWSEQSTDEMFNGWVELSYDDDVVSRRTIYTLATPRNTRVSLGVGNGPAGVVHVRNADGTVVTSGSIGAAPSFIEPWTFAPGQTIETERAGADAGSVTVTLFDVPPDVSGSIEIGGSPFVVRTTQPGQNGALTLTATRAERIVVHVTDNRVGAVTVTLYAPDATSVLAAMTSAAPAFSVPAILPGPGAYTVAIDPAGANTGSLRVAVTRRGR